MDARAVKSGAKVAKVRDLSSDEDDILQVMYDPLVVSRSSAVGIIMQKWLTASRRRLGGIFPRPKAISEMAAYTRRMKKKADNKRGRPKDEDKLGMLVVAQKLPLSAASVALARRWLSLSRDRIIDTLRTATKDMLFALRGMMQHLTPNEDWYFTSETRLKGEALLEQGMKLLTEREDVEHDERYAMTLCWSALCVGVFTLHGVVGVLCVAVQRAHCQSAEGVRHVCARQGGAPAVREGGSGAPPCCGPSQQGCRDEDSNREDVAGPHQARARRASWMLRCRSLVAV
jgi:hypothetical protein